ncbi:GNAT family N-acetyltransferase [Pseudonocardia sp. Ae717_Ps2]|uniref:GNAT family N-acetyltransferase n=1 Tax=unclassified Pseudonocardia TaxID=2619320 RepID=UPI00094AD4AA|nr:hypothetical protein Ae717Ps2_7207c [Pseudonocardia sp. Ae717_Ps2]
MAGGVCGGLRALDGLVLETVLVREGNLSVFNGHLTGFVVVHDRDNDGDYETVAHIWTAVAWRRRGIARRLLAEARSRFSVTAFEEPYTKRRICAYRRLTGQLR